ncbi:MAG TPA: CHAT domain-containing protein, partial [Labilithrix sp.]|nr:CHAT domain-containing protein [Labilithrix sp.]
AKLEAEHDEISNKLVNASPLYRAQSQPVTIEAVQATIPDDSALVEYVYYHARDTSSPVFATKDVRFVAYVLHKSGDPVAVDLDDAVSVGRAIGEFRKVLSEQGDVLPHAKRVHELVVAPIAKHLRTTDKRLIISPDDDLNLVPFAALVDDKGRFLVQGYELAYVTSGRDLLQIAASSAQPLSNSKPVVFGDPSFDGSAGASSGAASVGTRAGDLDNARFPPLPGTAVEVKALSELLSATTFTQADATKARLTGVGGPVVLHVATHGFFLKRERDPAAAGTRALEYDPGQPAARPPLRSENPLVRSGLALAGANQRTTADGVLTALEVSSMNLDGTRLVVLSACETGVGQTEVGDGVYGLRRALVVAGSESQVMSLWKVDDEATRDLMIAFYRDLKAGAGRAAALRKVQLAMLAKPATQHPYFWAAFIPSGAWEPMRLDVQDSPAPPPVKDAPESDDREKVRKSRSGSTFLFGFHYASLTNLRNQPDRDGVFLSMDTETTALSRVIGRGPGFGIHDAALLSVYAGARTSEGVSYAGGEDEGFLSGGFRGGYELAVGMRGASWNAFVGGRVVYNTFIIGDARTYGATLPLIGMVGFRTSSNTFVSVRGHYGKWIFDQETAGALLSLTLKESLVVRGGVEQLKMPTSVSLDGDDLRGGAGRQVSTFGSFYVGGTF